jgi:hypothetical protein
MRCWRAAGNVRHVPETVSVPESAKDIAEHREDAHEGRAWHDRLVAITEAILLSVVALMAAWAGYSAAKWSTHSSLSIAKASATRNRSSLDSVQATQIRTLDSVSFNAAETAYTSGDPRLFRIAVRRLRPGYRPAFEAWLATHPLKNPNAPPDPSYMPQYRIPQEAEATALAAQSTRYFTEGESSAATADKYVRLTVILAAVLFLVGIGSRFPLRSARYVLVAVAAVLLVVSVVQLAGLPGPPS